jgi:hypothetical protein
MSNLRHLQLVMTFFDEIVASSSAARFNNSWHVASSDHDYSKLMRTIVKMIPQGVEVTCGLTQESLSIGDYGGFEPVDNAALQGLYDIHKVEQGRHWSSSSGPSAEP